jgi:hypothetical protein
MMVRIGGEGERGIMFEIRMSEEKNGSPVLYRYIVHLS